MYTQTATARDVQDATMIRSANAHSNNASYSTAETTVSPLRVEAIAAVASVASKAALMAAIICLYLVLARPDPAAIIVFVCATLSSIAGFAFSAISGPMLLHATADPVKAVHIMLVASIALQGYSVWALRKSIDLRELLPYFAGGLSTVVPGAYLLLHTPTAIYLLALGAFLTAYASYMLVRPPLRLGSNSLAGRVFVGALGGISGATAAFPGAFVTIWCTGHAWDKRQQRSIYQPFILGMQLVTLVVLALASPTDAMHLELLQYIAPAVLGSYLGLRAFSKLSTAQFNKVVNGLLLLSGIAMLLKAF
jgi:uncharacterized membrane protein YfcA